MNNIQWHNFSIFIRQENVPVFLTEFLLPKISLFYKNKEELNYFFYLDESRGYSLLLFMECFLETTNELERFRIDLIDAASRISISGVGTDVHYGLNKSEIFMPLPPGSVCYGLLKLKTIPYTNFSPEVRRQYYSVLKEITNYLLSLKHSDFVFVLEKKFLVCLSFVYDFLKELILKDARFLGIFSEAVDKEMTGISNAVGHPVEEGLKRTYEKNKLMLMNIFFDQLDNELAQILKCTGFSDVISYSSALLLRIDEDEQITDNSTWIVMIQSLVLETCTIFNLSNPLTCAFFALCILKEKNISSINTTNSMVE